MHAKPDLRVSLEWMIARSGSVITAVITLRSSMAKSNKSLLVIAIVLSVFLILPIGFLSCAYNFRLIEPFREFEYVADYVEDHKAELESLASNFQLGKFPESELIYLPNTTDSNGNVYFIVDSSVFATMGFLYRNGNAEILGDGSEPRVADERHIVDDWWYYLAN